jgi:hypothetical protein
MVKPGGGLGPLSAPRDASSRRAPRAERDPSTAAICEMPCGSHSSLGVEDERRHGGMQHIGRHDIAIQPVAEAHQLHRT